MTILNFEFEDKFLGWKLEPLSLEPLTLLVGASGVGKTQTLRAMMALKTVILKGKSINGLKWKVEFKTLNEEHCIWEVDIEKREDEEFFSEDINEEGEIKNQPKFISEKLIIDNEVVIDRKDDKILFLEQQTPKLSQQQSAIYLLREEEIIRKVYEEIEKLYFTNHSNSVRVSNKISLIKLEEIREEYDTIEKIQGSDLPISMKLYFLQKVDKNIFEEIKNRFTEIFPQVEDIKIEIVPFGIKNKEIQDLNGIIPLIQIKEKGVEKWISQNRISSGMFRTLMQLSELYLCQDGTVFLIDEFENSLGINCINSITSEILSSDRKLQFIITSHHPYIIDNIGYEHWKLVTRNGGIVKTHNISDFNIGKSRHSAFMQLIQLKQYKTGQE